MAFKIAKEISPQEVSGRLEQGEALNLLDVRELAEWAGGHVEGSRHIPLSQLMERYQELDSNQDIIVMCYSGSRSGLACELLQERGYHVINMTGGLSAWTGELVRD